MTSISRALAFTLASVIAGGALGNWVYDSYRKKGFRASVSVILQDTSRRMQEALTMEAGLPAEGRRGTGRQLDEHVAAVEQGLQQLKTLDGASERKLADAADGYLVTAREILRRQAASNRYRLALTKSLDSVREHMRADDRSGSWVTVAVRKREQADADYREYRMTTEAFGIVLDTLSGAEKKVAPYVDASLLSDTRLIEAARSRTLEALGDAAAEMEQIRQLVGVR